MTCPWWFHRSTTVIFIPRASVTANICAREKMKMLGSPAPSQSCRICLPCLSLFAIIDFFFFFLIRADCLEEAGTGSFRRCCKASVFFITMASLSKANVCSQGGYVSTTIYCHPANVRIQHFLHSTSERRIPFSGYELTSLDDTKASGISTKSVLIETLITD